MYVCFLWVPHTTTASASSSFVFERLVRVRRKLYVWCMRAICPSHYLSIHSSKNLTVLAYRVSLLIAECHNKDNPNDLNGAFLYCKFQIPSLLSTLDGQDWREVRSKLERNGGSELLQYTDPQRYRRETLEKNPARYASQAVEADEFIMDEWEILCYLYDWGCPYVPELLAGGVYPQKPHSFVPGGFCHWFLVRKAPGQPLNTIWNQMGVIGRDRTRKLFMEAFEDIRKFHKVPLPAELSDLYLDKTGNRVYFTNPFALGRQTYDPKIAAIESSDSILECFDMKASDAEKEELRRQLERKEKQVVMPVRLGKPPSGGRGGRGGKGGGGGGESSNVLRDTTNQP